MKSNKKNNAPIEAKINPKGGGLIIPNYTEKIKNAKAVIKKPKGKLARASKVRPFFTPPCNTGIILTKLKKEKLSKKKLARALVLPENYFLKEHHPIVVCGDRNDPSISQFQQYACGCCWAYAIATAVSDVFVVQNKFLTNPNLSWTYILSCYPNEFNPGDDPAFAASALCGGGDVPSTLLWLQEKGLPSSMCVDYAWCLNDPNCTGSGTNTKDMNVNIPSCGCYNSGNFFKYKIKDVRRIALDDTNDQNPEQITLVHSQIRQHLFVNGTMVGCFHVLENIVAMNNTTLKTGDFKSPKNPEGVYLECVGVDEEVKAEVPSDGNELDACIYKYEDGSAKAPDTPGEALGLLGAHAVCIVGWGMAPVSRSLIRPDIERLYPTLKTSEKDPTMVMVPYWWVRNSWGTTFAENGFFKFAAYPFNRVSCLERSIKITSDGRSVIAGGCVLFLADQVVRDSFPENDQKGREQASASATKEKKDGGGGVETGHFEGAKKSAVLGDPIPYVQSSYSAEKDVLPETGTYQAPTSAGPQAQQQGEEKKPITFEEETVAPPPGTKFPILFVLFVLCVVLLVSVGSLYLVCKYYPDKCPGFLRSYFPPAPTAAPIVPPTAAPPVVGVSATAVPPAGIVPRVPVVRPPVPTVGVIVPRVPVVPAPVPVAK